MLSDSEISESEHDIQKSQYYNIKKNQILMLGHFAVGLAKLFCCTV